MRIVMQSLPQLNDCQIKHFWSRIDVKNISECWQWMGCKVKGGYGQTSFNGVLYIAHRIAYFLHTNEDPRLLKVCHSCDTPSCCNPHHLWAGTQRENLGDMVAKQRSPNNCGRHNPSAKLNEEQVRQIRGLFKAGVRRKELAQQYNISYSTIKYIVRYKSWTHVKG